MNVSDLDLLIYFLIGGGMASAFVATLYVAFEALDWFTSPRKPKTPPPAKTTLMEAAEFYDLPDAEEESEDDA